MSASTKKKIDLQPSLPQPQTITAISEQKLHIHKSSVTVSKSSSEGDSSLDGIDTSLTSMEESKNPSPINKSQNGTTNTINTLLLPIPSLHQFKSFDLQNNSAKTELVDTATIPNTATNSPSSPTETTRKTSTQTSTKDITSGKNFNTHQTSLLHIQEDSSSKTSSSDDNTTSDGDHPEGQTQNQTFGNSNTYHGQISYHHGLSSAISSSNNDSYTRRLSSVDPLAVIDDENTPLIPLPHSEPHPVIIDSEDQRPQNQHFKSNTYPRSTTENAFQNDSDRRTTLPNGTQITNHSGVGQKHFQSINTIKIPDNYQKTELAGHNRATVVHPDHAIRHRITKSTSFMNTSRKKSRMRADDLYNIPGQTISENHQNYAIVYDLVTGIRFSVSRCSKNPVSVTDNEFKQVTKLIFNRQGNTQAPPTKYEFKFKDYAPEVFRDLRSMFNINQADYLMSLNDEIGVRAVGSSGKSGSSFYYSNDRKFIIKTIHRSEHKHLRRILKDYYYYVKNNPNTLLCQFYGLHRLKMATRTGTVKVHVLVMNNLLPPSVNIGSTYDLKGSTYGRKTSEQKRLKGSCMKDLNFIENKTEIYLSTEKKIELENQLKSDVALLKRLNIMDYSLLLGFKYLNKEYEIDERTKRFSMITHQDVPGAHKNSILDTDGGIRAINTEGEEMDIVYYIGIIDCLTNYNTLKKLETFFRSLRHKRETISAVPPGEYGDRFLRFIFDHIRSPGDKEISKRKSQGMFNKTLKKLSNPHHHFHTA